MANRNLHNGVFPPEIISGVDADSARIKTEQLSISQQYIVNGWGWYFEVDYPSLASGGRVYFEFTVPQDAYVALDYRQIITDKERVFYYVYPSGAYGTTTATSALNIRNLRNDVTVQSRSDLINSVTVSPAPNHSDSIIHIPIFGAIGAGNRASGDIEADNIFRLLAPSSKFLVEVYNASDTACYINISLVFGLIPAAGFQKPITF